MSQALITQLRNQFHRSLAEKILFVNSEGVPTNADKDSRVSVAVASALVDEIGGIGAAARQSGQTSGVLFERATAEFVADAFAGLGHVRPGSWSVFAASTQAVALSGFEQYRHLAVLEGLARENPELATALGSDYVIKPDVLVVRSPEEDSWINRPGAIVDSQSALLSPLRSSNGREPILHASISCKWTLRSDRAQNARSEGLNLSKNRKGRLPHVMVVTAEPLPSRLASLALGTGEIDMVYHFALPELLSATKPFPEAWDLLNIMIEGSRLKDIADLPLDLVL